MRPRGSGDGRLSKDTRRSLSLAMTLILASGLVAGTTASFNASTSNRDNAFAMASLTAPQGLTASASGNAVALSWSAGSFGGGTGFGHRLQYRNLGVEADPRDGADGPSTACAASDIFTSAPGRASASTTTFTHSGVATGAAGSYACYKVDTEYPATPSAAQWFSQNDNPVATVMLGHVVKSVTAANGGAAGTLDPGDVFTFTFNQTVNIATGPTSTSPSSGVPTSGEDVCIVSSSGVVIFGRTGQLNRDCNTGHSRKLGDVSGLTMSPGGEKGAYHATYTWSDCPAAGQCRVLAVTLGTRYRDNKNVNITGGSPSFTPTGAYLTSATGGVSLCNTANTATTTCRPVPIGTV